MLRRGYMQIEDFVERLCRESAGNHRIFPSLDNEELEAWISRWSKTSLTEDFLDLLRHTNGIQFWVHEGSPNGYFRILPLREVDTARRIMWGEAPSDMNEDEVPYPHWLAITEDQDGATFIVLDPDAHRYYLMDSCGADLTCPAGNSIYELLDYIWDHWIEAMEGNQNA